MSNCDFIKDFLQRMQEAIQRSGTFSEELGIELEHQMRRDYGGETVYISKRGDSDKFFISQRNQAIIHDMNAGERVGLIARRYSISRRMVYKIWDDYLIQRKKL